MRYTVNWKFRTEYQDANSEVCGGQFPLLASDIDQAMELGAADAFRQLDLVEAMIPHTAAILISVCDPRTNEVLSAGWLSWTGEPIYGGVQ